MTDLSDLIAELRRLHEAATPGPWAIESCGEKGDGSNMIGVLYDPDVDPDCERPLAGWVPACRPGSDDFIEYYVDETVAECEHRNPKSGQDAALIAATRNALPRLLDEVEELQRWKQREHETQEALQAIGEEFGVYGGEPRVDGIRRVLTEARERTAKMESALRNAARNDRTRYNHHEPRPFDGRKPSPGTIWLSPREIARRVLGEPRLATGDDLGGTDGTT